MDDKTYYVYMMTNWKNSVLYTGVTSDLRKRIYQHKTKATKRFTEKYNCTKLIYFESTTSAYSAISKEKQIKGWRRDKKECLIDSMNPERIDLSESWY